MYRNLLALFIPFFVISCSSQSSTNMHKHTNDLIHESSPYLLQHAHNPVNWHAWNPKTLALAKKEKKLIIVSIGYSACHWCHVMEHESFEDTTVAAVMNKHYINIKVDREERPDVDQVYMDAVQLMTGRGGWPLNVVTLPDGRPVWGGTYFRKNQWINSLENIAETYKNTPQKLNDYAQKLSEGLHATSIIEKNFDAKEFTVSSIKNAVLNWTKRMDFELGGPDRAPKFPLPNNYQFLLRYGMQAADTQIKEQVQTTLTKMALGGIFDQVGGGFARYSTDKKWHIPHFEKMLYDNGQLVSLYSDAYLATKNELYKETVYQTLAFIERELHTKEGAFYAALDADSKNQQGHLEEGAFYVWKKPELQALIKNDFSLFEKYYNINSYGAWENGTYNLIRTQTDSAFAKTENIDLNTLKNKVNNWRATLLKERNKRERPRLDDKALTAWNAMMLKGYIDAYRVFNDTHFLEIALANAHFINTKLSHDDGSLYHTYKNGKATINGYLEDYATVIDAYIALYEATLDEQWLLKAKQLTQYVFTNFHDAKSKFFFFTSRKDDALITRKIDTDDNVIPSSNSIMARNLFKLSHYFSNHHYLETAEQMLHTIKPKINLYPSGYSNWLQLEADLAGTFYEIAVSGKIASEKIKEINQHYIPNKLIAGSTGISEIPLLEGRIGGAETLIYICVDGACQLPQKSTTLALKQIQTNF